MAGGHVLNRIWYPLTTTRKTGCHQYTSLAGRRERATPAASTQIYITCWGKHPHRWWVPRGGKNVSYQHRGCIIIALSAFGRQSLRWQREERDGCYSGEQRLGAEQGMHARTESSEGRNSLGR
eukprot:365427-Chlamydomonas_euryale.AAC.9